MYPPPPIPLLPPPTTRTTTQTQTGRGGVQQVHPHPTTESKSEVSYSSSSHIQVFIRIRPFIPLDFVSVSLRKVVGRTRQLSGMSGGMRGGGCISYDGATGLLCLSDSETLAMRSEDAGGGGGGSAGGGALLSMSSSMNLGKKYFHFSEIVGPTTSLPELYARVGHPLVEAVRSGFSGTLLAYGQTGAGKTHSTFAPDTGVVWRVLREILSSSSDGVDAPSSSSVSSLSAASPVLCRVSLIEVYNDSLYDLFLPTSTEQQQLEGGGFRNSQPPNRKTQKKKMSIRETPDGKVYVEGVSSFACGFNGGDHVNEERRSSEMDMERETETRLIFDRIRRALDRRVVAATRMNRISSRGHVVLIVRVRRHGFGWSTLTVVDLAGSEKLKKTNSTGKRLQECKFINRSLAALGNCISALIQRGENQNVHVPFRDSKLTRLLTNSLNGQARTSIICCVGPSPRNFAETYSTLLFALRAQKVRVKPRLNLELAKSRMEGRGLEKQIQLMAAEKMVLMKRVVCLERELSLVNEQQENLQHIWNHKVQILQDLVQRQAMEMKRLKNQSAESRIVDVLLGIPTIRAELSRRIEGADVFDRLEEEGKKLRSQMARLEAQELAVARSFSVASVREAVNVASHLSTNLDLDEDDASESTPESVDIHPVVVGSLRVRTSRPASPQPRLSHSPLSRSPLSPSHGSPHSRLSPSPLSPLPRISKSPLPRSHSPPSLPASPIVPINRHHSVDMLIDEEGSQDMDLGVDVAEGELESERIPKEVESDLSDQVEDIAVTLARIDPEYAWDSVRDTLDRMNVSMRTETDKVQSRFSDYPLLSNLEIPSPDESSSGLNEEDEDDGDDASDILRLALEQLRSEGIDVSIDDFESDHDEPGDRGEVAVTSPRRAEDISLDWTREDPTMQASVEQDPKLRRRFRAIDGITANSLLLDETGDLGRVQSAPGVLSLVSRSYEAVSANVSIDEIALPKQVSPSLEMMWEVASASDEDEEGEGNCEDEGSGDGDSDDFVSPPELYSYPPWRRTECIERELMPDSTFVLLSASRKQAFVWVGSQASFPPSVSLDEWGMNVGRLFCQENGLSGIEIRVVAQYETSASSEAFFIEINEDG